MIREKPLRSIRPSAILALLLVVAMLGIPSSAIQAAPQLQENEAGVKPIGLGEYVFNEMENGESERYAIEIPEAASYLVTAVDEEEAIAFDLIVTDAGAAEIFNDIFETIELALEPGTVTLEFIAVDRALLEFVILGQIGEMSDDPDQPGILPVGGIYTGESVSSPRYALLSVPATDYPQQVLIAIDPDVEDVIFVTVEGDDIGVASASSDDEGLLQFWTHGGDYLITAEPAERRSMFTLIPFLSGPPAPLTLNEPLETNIPAGSTEAIYALTVDSALDTLSIDLTAATDNFNITLVDHLYDGAVFESSFGDVFLDVGDVAPGTYYLIIETEASGEDAPVTVLATSESGAPLEPTQDTQGDTPEDVSGDALVNGEVRSSQIEEEGQIVFFTYEVEEPGSNVTVAISSDSVDTDFDLAVGPSRDEAIWSSFDIGSNEAVSFIAPSAGVYYIGVESAGGIGDFTIVVEEGSLVDLSSGEPVNGQLQEVGQIVYYIYEIQEPDTAVTIALSSDTEDTDFDLEVGLSTDESLWSSRAFGSNEAVSFVAPSSGIYYIGVESVTGTGDFAIVVKETPLIALFNGEAAGGRLEEEEQTIFYTFEVREPGTLVTVELTSDTEDTDFELGVGLSAENLPWSSRDFGSNESVTFVAPAAGVYYIGVESASGSGDFTIMGEEGELAPAVTENGLTWGSVGEDEDMRYRLEIAEPGQLLTIIMVGQNGVDLDLNVTAYGIDGDTVDYLSSVTSGGEEIVSWPIAEPGLYEVMVSPGFADSGNFFLLTRLENPGLLAGQWAIDGFASSEYGDDDYSALQATGAPDTPGAGDYATTWASESAEAGEQILELNYENMVVPHAINIYETFNPGAVVAIDAYDLATDTWVTLWEGEAAVSEEPMRIFSPSLNEIDFATDTIQLVLDTDTVEGWNEIDAVELLGRP